MGRGMEAMVGETMEDKKEHVGNTVTVAFPPCFYASPLFFRSFGAVGCCLVGSCRTRLRRFPVFVILVGAYEPS